jgi:hypothetical protein
MNRKNGLKASMKSSFFFDSMAIALPKDDIFRRLGYRKGVTRLEPQELAEMDRAIDDALSFIHLRGIARRIAIEEKRSTKTLLSTGETLKSRNLARMLRNSEEIMLMGATAGPAVMDAIRDDSLHGRMTRGVILDAVASEMVDHALDWMVAFFNQDLRRERRQLTKSRFSAGYGDFLLENQKWIYDALDLGRLGVELSESFILTPEKSVTALAGIEKVE